MSERQQPQLKLDEIGYWSEIKLDIIRQYAREYSKILTSQRAPSLSHVYIDAFAGAGVHKSKSRDEEIPGSPQNAVDTDPPFREYHFIDLNGTKANHLRKLFQGQDNVRVYEGDCNQIMLEEVLPKVRYADYRRGLCLLDPYGLHLNWEVILAAGQMGTMEVFLNFPIMDMNRNVFLKNLEDVDKGSVERMNAFWGDDSWRGVMYRPEPTLFGPEETKTNKGNAVIAEAFRKRLKEVAGFSYVPRPIPMRNSMGFTLYYLYFASQKPVAQKIVTHIFKLYENRGSKSVTS